MIGRRAGRIEDRAGAASSEPRREWSAARGPARGPALGPAPPAEGRARRLSPRSESLPPARLLRSGPWASASSRATFRWARRPEGVAAPRAAHSRPGEYFGAGDGPAEAWKESQETPPAWGLSFSVWATAPSAPHKFPRR